MLWRSAASLQGQVGLLAAASVGYGKVAPPSWFRIEPFNVGPPMGPGPPPGPSAATDNDQR